MDIHWYSIDFKANSSSNFCHGQSAPGDDGAWQHIHRARSQPGGDSSRAEKLGALSIKIWRFHGFIVPKMDVYHGKCHEKMDDLGVYPYFRKPTCTDLDSKHVGISHLHVL